MRPALWFVVPAHARLELSRVCLRQLRRTCDQLESEGIDASAVVIACDENLDTARELGFATATRDNTQLSRRFNDGIQLACDPSVNRHPVDYIVTCGSDDWVDHRMLLDLPDQETVGLFRWASFVSEDAQQIASRYASIDGWGIRTYPRQVLATLRYRPAEEDRNNGCDTSILLSVRAAIRGVKFKYGDMHERQIIDWKSHENQIHPYSRVSYGSRHNKQPDPFAVLADAYPAEAIREMQELY